MKVFFLKKKLLCLASCVIVFLLVFSLNFTCLPVGATYFNASTKKLPIYSVKTAENKLSISFDAAWGADKTSEIMSVCESYNVKATFFLVGFWIEKYPDKVKEIYNRGFEIGIHSSTHPDMTKLNKNEIRKELTDNINLVKELTNYTPKLFRPPYGYYNNDLIEVCEELNLSCIEWSVDSLDWKGLSASEIAGRVVSQSKSGSIILCHNNSDNIIDGLKMILTAFNEKKLELVPIGDLIYYEDYTIDVQGTQIKN
ncbi:MAG: polysaccharide deacetylase family protein [Clostridiales bacterium]|nr:polysaccharide deacetylase family protein [Clostridiales bacterium]